MGTSYPAGLDNFTNPTSSDTLDSVTVPHATQHADLNDAVEAIETELGTNPSGSATDVATRLSNLDTTVAGKVSFPLSNTAASSTTAQYSTDVTGDSVDRFTIDAAGKHAWGAGSGAADLTLERSGVGLLSVGGQFGVGTTTAAASTATFKMARTATGLTATYSTFLAADALTWSSSGLFAVNIFDISGTYTLNAIPLGGVNGMQFRPTVNGSGTGAVFTGIRVSPSITVGTALTSYTGLSVTGGASDTVTTVGLSMTSLTGATTWALNIGDFQSYHTGRLSLGGSTAPTYALDIKGTAQDRGVIAFAESVATPTNPSASAQALLYMKADKLVIGYLDGATMRYKYLDLTGTGVTWTHSTTAP